MRLRDVEPGDVDAYIRMRCDPAMTVHLGGPQAAGEMPGKVARDVAQAQAGSAQIKMIMVPGDSPDEKETVAGTVALWTSQEHGDPVSEIGWMVLPEFQGRGLAKQAVAALLRLAGEQGGWGPVHAYPGVGNEPSNRVCRALGFTWAEELDLPFAGQVLRVNDWVTDPVIDPAQAG
jgi:RimJ/RimL family protein N-acetyltransferase